MLALCQTLADNFFQSWGVRTAPGENSSKYRWNIKKHNNKK